MSNKKTEAQTARRRVVSTPTPTQEEEEAMDPIAVAVVLNSDVMTEVAKGRQQRDGKRASAATSSNSNKKKKKPEQQQEQQQLHEVAGPSVTSPVGAVSVPATSSSQPKSRKSDGSTPWTDPATTKKKPVSSPPKGSSQRKLRKHRRCRRRTPEMLQKMQRLLQLAKQDAKQALEEERRSILERLPAVVRDQFGCLGFCKHGKTQHRPALILSPYDVPPGPVRQEWMDLYHKMIQQGRPLEQMSHLVFLYDDASSRFYTMVSPRRFVPYEQATPKMKEWSNLALAKQQQQRRRFGQILSPSSSLSTDDLQKIKGHAWFQQDLILPQSQRKRGITEFQEGYELLSLTDVEEELSDGDDLESWDDENDDKATEVEEDAVATVSNGGDDQNCPSAITMTTTTTTMPPSSSIINQTSDFQVTLQQTLQVLNGLQTGLTQFTTMTPPTTTTNTELTTTLLLQQQYTALRSEFDTFKAQMAHQIASLQQQLQTLHYECTVKAEVTANNCRAAQEEQEPEEENDPEVTNEFNI